jgi:hypothetical protein
MIHDLGMEGSEQRCLIGEDAGTQIFGVTGDEYYDAGIDTQAQQVILNSAIGRDIRANAKCSYTAAYGVQIELLSV